jgi:hypothetical protein
MIAPVFVFDSREKWFPGDPLEMIRMTGARVPQSFSRWIRDAQIRDDDKEALDFPASMKPADLESLPRVGYHRVQQGGGLWWHQYWLVYAMNPWDVAGIGRHEGDWEFVQLGCTDRHGDHPVLVTCSQHHTGGKREYWACQLTDDQVPQPYVYVALGSHATYFTPGTQGGGIDHCDAQGPVIHGNNTYDIEWRPFGSWASWPGRWGTANARRSPRRARSNVGEHRICSIRRHEDDRRTTQGRLCTGEASSLLP